MPDESVLSPSVTRDIIILVVFSLGPLIFELVSREKGTPASTELFWQLTLEQAPGPDFAEAELEEPAQRVNPDGGEAERERDAGMRNGSHGYRKKTPAMQHEP
jgi:hypothetical protein